MLYHATTARNTNLWRLKEKANTTRNTAKCFSRAKTASIFHLLVAISFLSSLATECVAECQHLCVTESHLCVDESSTCTGKVPFRSL